MNCQVLFSVDNINSSSFNILLIAYCTVIKKYDVLRTFYKLFSNILIKLFSNSLIENIFLSKSFIECPR